MRVQGRRSRRVSPVRLPPLFRSAAAHPLASFSTCAVCCIYHKPRQFDESSSSESSDSDSDSDADSDAPARRRCNHDHDHDHDHGHSEGTHGTASRNGEGGGVVHELESDSDDTNAYERMPRRKPKKPQSSNDCESQTLLSPCSD